MIEFTLPAMSCGHCERTVVETVSGVDPAAKVEVDLATKRVRIDSAQGPGAFAEALAGEGYPPAH